MNDFLRLNFLLKNNVIHNVEVYYISGFKFTVDSIPGVHCITYT